MRATSTKLHLGCGLTTPQGWLNVDGSFNARVARWPVIRKTLGALGLISRGAAGVNWPTNIFHHDVRKRLPWADGTFEVVYASHLLEHLHVSEALRLLKECFRVLRPGGVARIVVPDLRAAVEDYLKARHHPETRLPEFIGITPADEFNARALFHEPEPPKGNLVVRTIRLHNAFHQHKWMYDEVSLAKRLAEAGFAEVSRRGFLESRILGIAEVEQKSRVEDGGLAVEGVKPER